MGKKNRSAKNFEVELQGLLLGLEAAGRAVLPLTNDLLLQSIVEAAARIFQAAAASILLINETEGVLEFKVAAGASNQDLVGMRFPLDQGIAGYVAMTGQPIATSNAEQDPRFHRDFAASTGYLPRSILAMPLLSGERVLGVMEVLDKLSAPSFGLQDMELLGIFAAQATLAIEMSQGLERLGEALAAGLKDLALSAGIIPSVELLQALDEAASVPARDDLLEMAALLNQVSRLGEAERETALNVLAAFTGYAQTRRPPLRGAVRR